MTRTLIRQPFSEYQNGVGVTGSNVIVTLPTVESGRYKRYDRIIVRDPDNNLTSVHITAAGGVVDVPLSEEFALTANHLYWDPYQNSLTEGEYIEVTFVGALTGDNLEVFAKGYEGSAGDL